MNTINPSWVTSLSRHTPAQQPPQPPSLSSQPPPQPSQSPHQGPPQDEESTTDLAIFDDGDDGDGLDMTVCETIPQGGKSTGEGKLELREAMPIT